MRIRKDNHFNIGDSLSGITDYLNTQTDKVSDLQPLANTMKQALINVGIKPPSELSNLAQVFHDNVVAPVQGYSANPIGNITSFVAKAITDANTGKPQSSVQKVVATEGQKVVTDLKTESKISDIFSNPIFWGVVLALVALVLWMRFK